LWVVDYAPLAVLAFHVCEVGMVPVSQCLKDLVFKNYLDIQKQYLCFLALAVNFVYETV
jgi:hypothetical protein